MNKRKVEQCFEKCFEWVGDIIYIKARGQETATRLSELLSWFHENQYDLPRGHHQESCECKQLKDELHTLWDKHNRLLKYLELEDVVMPETKKIRKVKKAKS